jgi:uncharacterized membrane protein
MLLASTYHFTFIDMIKYLLAEMTKIKAQMKAAEVYEVEAELKQQRRIERKKQQRETERETFRVTLQKVTYFYLILVHIFSISNIIFDIGLNLYMMLCTSMQMTKTVDLEDNLWAQKEFDMLIGSSCSYFWPRAAH